LTLRFLGSGDIGVFGMPLGGVGLLLDFTDPIEPTFDFAFVVIFHLRNCESLCSVIVAPRHMKRTHFTQLKLVGLTAGFQFRANLLDGHTAISFVLQFVVKSF